MIRGKPRLHQSLGFRLTFLLAMALLPLGVLSAIQGQSLQRELRARVEASILGQTRAAATGEQRTLEQASGAARMLAITARPLVHSGTTSPAEAETCNALARGLVEQSELFSFAGVYDPEGRLLCRSKTPPPDWRFPDEMPEGLTSAEPRAGVLENAEFTGRPVLYAQVPVLDEAGQPLAQAAVSVPHDLAISAEPGADGAPALDLITFEADGTIHLGLKSGLDLVIRFQGEPIDDDAPENGCSGQCGIDCEERT